jgi:hypothetical protein
MKTQRPGGATLPATTAETADAATPGKRTLVQDIQGADQAALGGGESLLQGMAQIEGETLFSGPDPTLGSEVPAVAAPDQTDADYEKTMGIKDAIDKKTMLPITGINGASFTATGCAGKKDGKVTFTFDRAFIGDYAYAAAGGKTVRGVHVCISAALSGCGEHKEVKLVQVLRNFTKKDGKVETAVPQGETRKKRSGSDDDKAKSKGWRVDVIDSKKTPFYVWDEIYGNDGSDKAAAKLRDTPGDWATSTNVGKEFRTCAVSYVGGKGTVLACVDWGYYIDDKGVASFYPAKPTAYTGAVPEILDAAERWDKMPGNDKANITQ